MRDVLLVDRDALVGRRNCSTIWLTSGVTSVVFLLSAGRLMSRPLLRQRQGRHEDDEQHEQHVDERRDVHVRTGVRNLAFDDYFGAEMLVGVSHY